MTAAAIRTRAITYDDETPDVKARLKTRATFVSTSAARRSNAKLATAPAVAAQRRGDRIAVWASWNGATEVARWEVLGGASPNTVAVIGGGARDRFETTLSVTGRHAYVAVRALDAGGAVLG